MNNARRRQVQRELEDKWANMTVETDIKKLVGIYKPADKGLNSTCLAGREGKYSGLEMDDVKIVLQNFNAPNSDRIPTFIGDVLEDSTVKKRKEEDEVPLLYLGNIRGDGDGKKKKGKQSSRDKEAKELDDDEAVGGEVVGATLSRDDAGGDFTLGKHEMKKVKDKLRRLKIEELKDEDGAGNDVGDIEKKAGKDEDDNAQKMGKKRGKGEKGQGGKGEKDEAGEEADLEGNGRDSVDEKGLGREREKKAGRGVMNRSDEKSKKRRR
jgi:hypothetical protein